MTTHTPAPWLVMGNQRNGHYDFVLPMADDKDFQANCRLIAAAPELLEALEYVSSRLPKNGDFALDDTIELTITGAGFKDICAILAKAKGES